MTAIAVWVHIMNTDTVVPGGPTHVHLILRGGDILAYSADVVVSPGVAIWISVPSPLTLRRSGAFETEGCSRQRILRRKWQGEGQHGARRRDHHCVARIADSRTNSEINDS